MSRASLCVIGGAGFVGRSVLVSLAARGRSAIALEHQTAVPELAGIERARGDLRDAGTLKTLLPREGVVINLAVTRDVADAERAAQSLGAACRAAGVRRLVHVSTVVVAGRTAERVVTEDTPCRPRSPYEVSKLQTERLLQEAARGAFQLAVLRPTAVFGAGGRNLVSMLDRLRAWPAMARYALACLHGKRRMHAVPVETVAAAATFLAERGGDAPHEVFIVSEDDDPLNNYRDIEDAFLDRWKLPRYGLPIAPLPDAVLRAVLRVRARSDDDPQRTYSPTKLRAAGFAPPLRLKDALQAFADAARPE